MKVCSAYTLSEVLTWYLFQFNILKIKRERETYMCRYCHCRNEKLLKIGTLNLPLAYLLLSSLSWICTSSLVTISSSLMYVCSCLIAHLSIMLSAKYNIVAKCKVYCFVPCIYC